MMKKAALESKILFKSSYSRPEEKVVSSCVTLSLSVLVFVILVQGRPAFLLSTSNNIRA